MGKFKNKISRFFYGRYGTDTLNKTLLWVYVAVVVIHTVASFFLPDGVATVASIVYFVLASVLIVIIFARMFSRNIPKRRRENERFCGFFRLRRNRFRDRKTHVYRQCPACRAVLRLPKAKGKHRVVCPRCQHRFEVRG